VLAIDEKLLRELSDTRPSTRNEAYANLREYCRRIAGLVAWQASGIDRDELTQEAIGKIIQVGGCSNYNPSLSSPGNYINMIMRRTCISMLRAREARIKSGHLEDYAIQSPDERADYPTLDQIEQNSILRAAVDELEPIRRGIVELAYFRGRSLSEVSKILRIPLGTVKSHLHKALTHLREALKDGRLEQTLTA